MYPLHSMCSIGCLCYINVQFLGSGIPTTNSSPIPHSYTITATVIHKRTYASTIYGSRSHLGIKASGNCASKHARPSVHLIKGNLRGCKCQWSEAYQCFCGVSRDCDIGWIIYGKLLLFVGPLWYREHGWWAFFHYQTAFRYSKPKTFPMWNEESVILGWCFCCMHSLSCVSCAVCPSSLCLSEWFGMPDPVMKLHLKFAVCRLGRSY